MYIRIPINYYSYIFVYIICVLKDISNRISTYTIPLDSFFCICCNGIVVVFMRILLYITASKIAYLIVSLRIIYKYALLNITNFNYWRFL